MASKKPSGRNIPNNERNTKVVFLRVDEELYERFRATHAAWKAKDPSCTLADVFEAALDALEEKGKPK